MRSGANRKKLAPYGVELPSQSAQAATNSKSYASVPATLKAGAIKKDGWRMLPWSGACRKYASGAYPKGPVIFLDGANRSE